jgi:hypothetical protein
MLSQLTLVWCLFVGMTVHWNRARTGVNTPAMEKMTDDGLTGLRPEGCWNDCLTRRKLIGLCVPSHIAYEVGAARQQTVRSPRTMDPHS